MKFPKKPPIRLKGAKWRKLKEQVLERDKRCVFCGTPFNLTAAHIVRKSQGGSDTLENVMAACVMRIDMSKGCHTRFDHYELELPEDVWDRMTDEHREQYLKTRGGK